jgi:hypothetical protein
VSETLSSHLLRQRCTIRLRHLSKVNAVLLGGACNPTCGKVSLIQKYKRLTLKIAQRELVWIASNRQPRA